MPINFKWWKFKERLRSYIFLFLTQNGDGTVSNGNVSGTKVLLYFGALIYVPNINF